MWRSIERRWAAMKQIEWLRSYILWNTVSNIAECVVGAACEALYLFFLCNQPQVYGICPSVHPIIVNMRCPSSAALVSRPKFRMLQCNAFRCSNTTVATPLSAPMKRMIKESRLESRSMVWQYQMEMDCLKKKWNKNTHKKKLVGGLFSWRQLISFGLAAVDNDITALHYNKKKKSSHYAQVSRQGCCPHYFLLFRIPHNIWTTRKEMITMLNGGRRNTFRATPCKIRNMGVFLFPMLWDVFICFRNTALIATKDVNYSAIGSWNFQSLGAFLLTLNRSLMPTADGSWSYHKKKHRWEPCYRSEYTRSVFQYEGWFCQTYPTCLYFKVAYDYWLTTSLHLEDPVYPMPSQ